MDSSKIDQMKAHANTGDYKSALRVAKAALREDPDALMYQYLFAKYLGDYADERPPREQKKMKGQAARMLKPLLRRLSGLPAEERFGICLNYYYQTEKFKEMYRFGRRFVRHNRRKANYAIGLAAGLVSWDLRAKKPARSKRWAEISARAWKDYGLNTERYYFAHYSYAKALALAGRKAEALSALKKAANLGRRPIEDWEFADVRELLTSS